MSKFVWEILVPKQMNCETQFTDTTFSDRFCTQPIHTIKMSHHIEWDEHVKRVLGTDGMTIMRSAIGQWRDEREAIIPVRIMFDCRHDWNESAVMREVVDFTAEHYCQYAILAYRISDCVIYKETQGVHVC